MYSNCLLESDPLSAVSVPILFNGGMGGPNRQAVLRRYLSKPTLTEILHHSPSASRGIFSSSLLSSHTVFGSSSDRQAVPLP